MSFVSPSRLPTSAKIALFDQPRSSTEPDSMPYYNNKKSNNKSNDNNNSRKGAIASPHSQMKVQHHNECSKHPSPRSPRWLGQVLNRHIWHHNSVHKSTVSPQASSHAFVTVTPDQSESEIDFSISTAMEIDVSPVKKTIHNLLNQMQRDLDPEDVDTAWNEENRVRYNEKLRKIQSILPLIDCERIELVNKCNSLDHERKLVTKELENREREISKLSRRCFEQASLVKEAVLIQRSNRDLTTEIKELTRRLSQSEPTDGQQIKVIKQELFDCRRDRDQMQRRFEILQVDYDKVAESLQDCLRKIANRDGDRQVQRDEQAMHKRMSIQQRSKQTDTLQRVQRTLQSRDEEIIILKQVVKDTQASQERLVSELETRYEAIVSKMQDENRLRLTKLSELSDRTKHECQSKIFDMHLEMESRDKLIKAMEEDIATCLDKLMSVTAEVQKAEEDSKMFDELTTDIEALQQERETLEECLHERDMTIAELSADLLRLEIEMNLALASTDRHVEQVPLKSLGSSCQSTVNSELSFLESQMERLVDELRSAKINLALRDDELATSRKEVIHLTGCLETQNDEHQELGDVLSQTISDGTEYLAIAVHMQDRQLKEISANNSILTQKQSTSRATEPELQARLPVVDCRADFDTMVPCTFSHESSIELNTVSQGQETQLPVIDSKLCARESKNYVEENHLSSKAKHLPRDFKRNHVDSLKLGEFRSKVHKFNRVVVEGSNQSEPTIDYRNTVGIEKTTKSVIVSRQNDIRTNFEQKQSTHLSELTNLGRWKTRGLIHRHAVPMSTLDHAILDSVGDDK